MPAARFATVAAIRGGAAAALGLCLAAPAPAQDFVTVPNIYANTSGGGASAILIAPQNNPWAVQLLWNPNQLADLAPGAQITGVTYRLSSAVPNGYPTQTTTWADYRISLGPSVLPTQATGTFANNFTLPPTLVRSGTLTVAPFAWPTGGGGGSNPTPWGVEIPFDTPYVYTGGPLALFVTHPGSDNPSFGNALLNATFAGSPGQGTDFTMIAGTGFNAPTGAGSVFSTVVRLTVVPVPEPAHLGLLVAAVPLASLAWRKRR